jgi:hypothetical protein
MASQQLTHILSTQRPPVQLCYCPPTTWVHILDTLDVWKVHQMTNNGQEGRRHFHGVPEEKGAMGYFNVTNAPANAVDGKDIALTKPINMNDWQTNLTKRLQKADTWKDNIIN